MFIFFLSDAGIDDKNFLLLEAEDLQNLIIDEGHCLKLRNKLTLLKEKSQVCIKKLKSYSCMVIC